MKKSRRIFGFNKQLKMGNKGEEFFIQCYQEIKARKGNGRVVDIMINEDETVELKSDQYSLEDTPNFFIERYGNLDKLKDGSVWKSSLDKINWFVYYYVPDRTFFWFKVEELKDFMEENMAKFQQRKIRNIGWEALGFLVPREQVRHLIKKEDKF